MATDDRDAQLVRLKGGTLVVTGAGSGIGRGIATVGAAAGMNVVLADLRADRLDEVATELRAGGAEVLAVPTDVRDYAAVEALAAAAFERFGTVRVLVNNAGIEDAGYIWELAPERWHAMVDVNVNGVFHGVRAFIPRMLSQGAPGAVVNLSSVGGISTAPMQAAYIATKHAVQALTECLEMELDVAGADISAHVVNPGLVKSQIFVDAAASGSAGEAPLAAMTTRLREEGIEPTEAGAIILAGVVDGGFWIVTHEEMQDRVSRQRAARLVERAHPVAARIHTPPAAG